MLDKEMRAYGEALDDTIAASLGRSRMADGSRVELSVEELALAVGAVEEGLSQERRAADED
ncbi:hypothetical protein ACF08B_28625 [Streptomyces sp. NPDC015139]|uniref:hypothetical protein n=1 Tax=Streptomyces sp. NPDC015139 TaxID=3364942 RepID=UPI0036FDADD8